MERITLELIENPIPKDGEIWIFKLPIEKLDTMQVSKSKSTKVSISNSVFKKGGIENYIIQPVKKDQVGELRELQIIGATKEGFQCGFDVSKVYHIIPDFEIATRQDLIVAGERAKNTPYVPRKQPEGMKIQSEPAEGEALAKTQARYKRTLPKVKSDSPKKKHKKVKAQKS